MAFNEKAFSATIIALLLASTLTAAFSIQPTETGGTICARANGSTDPPTTQIEQATGILSEAPPTEWNKTYGRPNDDVAYSVIQTSDGGYALAGSVMGAHNDFWLVKVGSGLPVHNLAISEIKAGKNIVGQGFNTSMNVTVINKGDFAETFNVTLYTNETVITTFTDITLSNGASTTLTFAWNTTGWTKGNYAISAYATPVPGETDTADNTLVDGWVLVTIIGDVNGDGTVDIYDLIIVASAFGSTHDDPIPPWNPNADINGDGTIDIFDLIFVAGHYGETTS